MAPRRRPRVLVIDDQPDEVRHLQVDLRDQLTVSIVHPEDVQTEALAGIDLFLVDYKLEEWADLDRVEVATRKPLNGVAVTGVLRSHAPTEGESGEPRAFALHSGRLEGLSEGLPAERREPVLARALNLEWVFAKGQEYEGVPLPRQIASLAFAVQALPVSWPRGDLKKVKRLTAKFLGLEVKDSWAELAWADVERCHPPIHELSEHSHGLAFLRWLLHRILPYPTFLWDSHHLAARLRVTHESLVKALEKANRLTEALDPFRYVGQLSGFVGARWWRAGIERFLWELTDGYSFDEKVIQEQLRRSTGRRLQVLGLTQPIVALDSNYDVLGFREAMNSVRIQPDDWPAYADDAWTTLELASSDLSLKSKVISEDRDRLQ